MEDSFISIKDEIGKYLSVVSYPAEIEGIIRDVVKVGAEQHIIMILQSLPPQKYHTPREVITQIQ